MVFDRILTLHILLIILIASLAPDSHAQPPLPGHGDDSDVTIEELHGFHVNLTSPQVAGEPFDVGITAVNATGDPVPTFSGSVDLSTNNQFGPGNYSNIGGFSGGTVTHTVTLTQASQNSTITASNTGGQESGTSDPFVVTHGALSSFAVHAEGGGNISNQVAGEEFIIRITARDSHQNTVTDFTGTVELNTDNDFDNDVSTTVQDFSDGVKTHPVILTSATADATISVSLTDGTESGVSNAFDIDPGPPDGMEMVVQPGNTVAGQHIDPPPAVRVVDAFGNYVPDEAVHVALNTNTFTQDSNTMAISDAQGVATFGQLATLTSGSGYYLMYTTGENVTANSDEFMIFPEGASALVVVTVAQQTVAGEPLAGPPAVRLIDQYNNPVPNVEVEARLNKNDFDGGSTTVISTDGQGIARFDNLRIQKAETGYQLTFEAYLNKRIHTVRMNVR